MLIDNIDFLKKVIQYLANEAYQEQIVDTGMEPNVIGEGDDKDWKSKDDWIKDTLIGWFDETSKTYSVEANSSVKNISPISTIIRDRFYKLEIGESFDLDNFTTVTRVPGGWIFNTSDGVAFIPYKE